VSEKEKSYDKVYMTHKPSASTSQMLDWNSNTHPIRLLVELPFWLRIPSHSKSVTIEDVDVSVYVLNDVSAFQSDSRSLTSHRNTIGLASRDSDQYYDYLKNTHSVEKPLKTVIAFDAFAIIDAINTLFNPDEIPASVKENHTRMHQNSIRYNDTFSERPANVREFLHQLTDIRFSRRNFGTSYFRTLSIGHISLLNSIINSYRKLVLDPFVYPVCEKDVPIWFIEYESKFQRVCIFLRQDLDCFPMIGDMTTGNTKPDILIDKPDHIWIDLSTPMSPEIEEICDAWTYFYEGRYEGTIRSIVTGIEIALDNGIRKLVRNCGKNDTDIEKYFKNKNNSFKRRYFDYCKMRNSYSPIIIPFAPIEGVCYDLKEKLFELREFRHDIVHRGKKINKNDKTWVYTYLDLMMPLFLWITEGNEFPDYSNKIRDYGMGHNLSSFEFRYRNKRIEVVDQMGCTDSEEHFEQMTCSYQLKQCLLKYADSSNRNVTFFVLASMSCCMFMHYYDVNVIQDLSADEFAERFFFFLPDEDGNTMRLVFAAFIIEPSCLSMGDILRIKKRICTLNNNGDHVHPVCFIDSQSQKIFRNRTIEGDVSGDVISFAKEQGITLITLQGMYFLDTGCIDNFWSSSEVVELLHQPGLITLPPKGTLIGHVAQVYKKLFVLSVLLTSQVSVGDEIIIWNYDSLIKTKITSMQKKGEDVPYGINGDKVGVMIESRVDISPGAMIYKIEK